MKLQWFGTEPGLEVFGWSRSWIPNNTGSRVGVGFFCSTPDVQLVHFYNHPFKLGIPIGMVSFETFVETDISCCAPRFPLILTATFHSLYVKESE